MTEEPEELELEPIELVTMEPQIVDPEEEAERVRLTAEMVARENEEAEKEGE
jgi:hypothetical protein